MPSPRTGPVVAEIGIFRDAVSAQFGGLRRASVINVLAVCALLTALIATAVRFPAYVRGRQTEALLLLARRVQQDLLSSAMRSGAMDASAQHVAGSAFRRGPVRDALRIQVPMASQVRSYRTRRIGR